MLTLHLLKTKTLKGLNLRPEFAELLEPHHLLTFIVPMVQYLPSFYQSERTDFLFLIPLYSILGRRAND